MKSLKKILAVVLSLAMVLGTMTVTSLALTPAASVAIGTGTAKEYGTFDAAVAAAASGTSTAGSSATIKLLKDVSSATRVDFRVDTSDKPTRTFTLDLNGKTYEYTGTDSNPFLLNANTTMVVEGGEGTLKSATKLFNGNKDSKYIVKSGNFEGSAMKAGSTTVVIEGGTFNIDPTSYVDSSKFEVTKSGSEPYTWTVTEKSTVSVASVINHGNSDATKSYDTLKGAIDAAGKMKDATIKALDDCSIAERGVLRYSDSNTTERAFTLDLNGKTVTSTSTNGIFIINENTTVTVKGGSLTSSTGYLLYGNAGSNIVITDGTYSAGTKNIIGGKANLTITGGTFTAAGLGNYIDGGDPSKSATVVITGGTFNFDPSAYVDTSLCEVTSSAGTWTVKSVAASVTIGSTTTNYNSLEAACTAAVSGTTDAGTAEIKLLADATVGTRIALCTGTSMSEDKVARTINLDLNGYTITASSKLSGILGINKNGTLNISDSSETQTGALIATSDMTYYIYFPSKDCKLNISGGTWKGAESATIGSAYGAPVVSGGVFDFDPSTDEKVQLKGTVLKDTPSTGLYTVEATKAASVTISGTTTNYADLTSAWAAATAANEATIKVLTDASLTENMTDIPNGCALTLDLNGKTISTTKRFVQTYGDFTITDTSAEKAGAIVYGGSLSNSTYGIVQASYSSSKGTGTFTLEAGTIKAETAMASNAPAVVATSTSGSNIEINIKGGTIEAYTGQNAIAVRKGTCTIKDGKVLGALDNASAAGTFDISGGVFSVNPTSYLNTSLYEATANTPSTGLYTVGLKSGLTAVAKIDSTEYYTIGDAVDAILATATKTGTIKLTGETLDAPIEISDADAVITIDLDGKRVKPAESSRFIYVTAGTVTVKNGTVLSNGVISVAGLLYFKDATVSLTSFNVNGDATNNDILTNVTKKNGTIYLMGCDATMDNVSITNCKAYDSSTMTGNSGAIHLVRNTSNNNKGTTLTMKNCYIDNCASAVQGGAISVGSDCVLNINKSNIIEDCSSANGGAIFIDVANYESGDYACGELHIDSDIIENCAGTGMTSTAPIFSKGFAYIDETITTTGDVYQAISVSRIESASVTLSDCLTYNFTVEKAKATGAEDIAVTAKVGDGTAETLTAADGKYSVDVTAAQMADSIVISMASGTQPTANDVTTSIVDYCERVYKEYPTDAKLTALLADTLVYGSETQKYWGQGKAFDLSDTTLTGKATSVTPQATDNIKATTLSATDSANYLIKSATLNVNYKVSAVFVVYTTDANAKLVVTLNGGDEVTYNVTDGEVLGTDTYRVEIQDLKATEYNDKITATLTDGSAAKHAVDYSVNSYCYNMQSSAKVGAIAKAIYRYGVSAEALPKSSQAWAFA